VVGRSKIAGEGEDGHGKTVVVVMVVIVVGQLI
jgi:hypothetical protein